MFLMVQFSIDFGGNIVRETQYYLRKFSKGVCWDNGIQKITMAIRGSFLDVFFYPDMQVKDSNFRLFLSLPDSKGFLPSYLKVADLFDSCPEYRNKGIGTLMFNLALQLCFALYGKDSGVKVEGEIVPADNGGFDDPRENIRRVTQFWAKFGFAIDSPESERPFMNATLKKLSPIDGGFVLDGIPSTLSIEAFVVESLAHVFAAKDELLLSELPTHASHELISSQNDSEINIVSEITKKEQQILFGFAGLAFTPLTLGFLGVSWASGAILSIASLGLAWCWKTNYLLEYMPSERAKRRETRFARSNSLIHVRKHFQPLWSGDNRNRFCSLYRRVSEHLTGLNLRESSVIKIIRSGKELDDEQALQAAELTLRMKQCIKERETALKPKPERESAPHSDFLFGHIYSSLDFSDLERWSEILRGEFGFHLERLLADVRELTLYGSSNATFDEILKHCAHEVALIDIYGDTTHQYGELSVRVFMRAGTLYAPNVWTTYKSLRSSEFASVLFGLKNLGLLERVYVRWGAENQRTQINQDLTEAMQEVLLLCDQYYSPEEVASWFEQRVVHLRK